MIGSKCILVLAAMICTAAASGQAQVTDSGRTMGSLFSDNDGTVTNFDTTPDINYSQTVDGVFQSTSWDGRTFRSMGSLDGTAAGGDLAQLINRFSFSFDLTESTLVTLSGFGTGEERVDGGRYDGAGAYLYSTTDTGQIDEFLFGVGIFAFDLSGTFSDVLPAGQYRFDLDGQLTALRSGDSGAPPASASYTGSMWDVTLTIPAPHSIAVAVVGGVMVALRRR